MNTPEFITAETAVAESISAPGEIFEGATMGRLDSRFFNIVCVSFSKSVRQDISRVVRPVSDVFMEGAVGSWQMQMHLFSLASKVDAVLLPLFFSETSEADLEQMGTGIMHDNHLDARSSRVHVDKEPVILGFKGLADDASDKFRGALSFLFEESTSQEGESFEKCDLSRSAGIALRKNDALIIAQGLPHAAGGAAEAGLNITLFNQYTGVYSADIVSHLKF